MSETEKITKRTQEDKMLEVNAILAVNAKNKNCKVSDLQWKRDKYGNIHIRRRDAAQKRKE